MSMQTVGSLVDRWMQDATFRAALRKKPEETIKSCGIAFTAEELATFRQIDWKLNDEELKSRVGKALV